MHVADPENSQGENGLLDITGHVGFVVGLFAPDRFDRQQIGAGQRVFTKRGDHVFPLFAAVHVFQAAAFAHIDHGGAQRRLDARFIAEISEHLQEYPADIDAPADIPGAGWQQFDFSHQSGDLEFFGPPGDPADYLPVDAEHLRHRIPGNQHRGQGEVDLRVNRSPSDNQIVLQGNGGGGPAEQERVCRRIGQLVECPDLHDFSLAFQIAAAIQAICDARVPTG